MDKKFYFQNKKFCVIMAKLTFMETYRSGHNGPDSKSVGRLCRLGGSNPPVSVLTPWMRGSCFFTLKEDETPTAVGGEFKNARGVLERKVPDTEVMLSDDVKIQESIVR